MSSAVGGRPAVPRAPSGGPIPIDLIGPRTSRDPPQPAGKQEPSPASPGRAPLHLEGEVRRAWGRYRVGDERSGPADGGVDDRVARRDASTCGRSRRRTLPRSALAACRAAKASVTLESLSLLALPEELGGPVVGRFASPVRREVVRQRPGDRPVARAGPPCHGRRRCLRRDPQCLTTWNLIGDLPSSLEMPATGKARVFVRLHCCRLMPAFTRVTGDAPRSC